MHFIQKATILIVIGGFLILPAHAAAQKKIETDTMWVAGVCEMCKQRIEKSLDLPGVVYAAYNIETHQLIITYNTKKITSDKIHDALHQIGNDTQKGKAPDEKYEQLHHCCKYRDE